MKLVIITKPTYFVEEDKILTALFEEGMESLHLYKTDAQLSYTRRLLSLLPSTYHKRITLHCNYELAEEFGLAGIHLEDATSSPLGRHTPVSRTCRHLSRLKDLKRIARYVVLADVFGSRHDASIPSRYTISQLEEAHRQGLIDRHVYAWGGMEQDRIKLAKNMGFGGVLVGGDLWERFDIHHQQDFNNILSHFDQLKNAAG